MMNIHIIADTAESSSTYKYCRRILDGISERSVLVAHKLKTLRILKTKEAQNSFWLH